MATEPTKAEAKQILSAIRQLDKLISGALGEDRRRRLNERCDLIIKYIKQLGHRLWHL